MTKAVNMSGKNFLQVAIKVRPLFGKEKDQPSSWRIVDNSIQLLDTQTDPYYFDHIFDQDASNQIIFDKVAKQIVHSALQGFNGTIFAYGQTSSGKTYTMMGYDDNPGVMVLAAKEIFKEIERSQDRQFLLRVGYIEIYNEKIYDLLNKKNQDLKIHETSNGIISVNCEEIIIRSEDDLLLNLEKGGKERTVGETNMNERSSRSHAIFRIIIESSKIDRTEDDAVIQSVINLVDLAGSERADQTGARGTRFKEGAHINKSLLFLSNVIKRLSENEDDKYISFRDSKLTRILQASLGGNALTAIICTIKPNAIEETQSTLNFALRAKAIKNKPQVNETVSDATMMKRLEHEIKVLKNRLEEEQRKNESQIKVRQLEQRIKDEDLKIISCNSLHFMRSREKRRRTWCPSSTNLNGSTVSQTSSALPLPVPTFLTSGISHPSRLQPPKKSYYNTPLITMRPPPESPAAPKISGGIVTAAEDFPVIDEEFTPAESVNFDILVPQKTPENKPILCKISITPKLIDCAQSTLEKIESDLQELQSFTNWESKVEVQHDEPVLTLKHQVETLRQRNTELEKERLEHLQLEKEIEALTESLSEAQNKLENFTKRNAELEVEKLGYLQLKDVVDVTTEDLTATKKRCDELQVQLSKLINSNTTANETIAKHEAELAELKKTNERLEMENREAVNLEFEYKRHKNKSKLRENELLELLHHKEKEISKLEKSLNTIKAERLQNTKDELLHRSLNESDKGDHDGKFCIKCEDLKSLLEENKKNTLEFEKLTLEYEQLKLNYDEVAKENATHKSKIVHLEELQEKEKLECETLLSEVDQLRNRLAVVQRDYEQLGIENSSKHEECVVLNRQVELAKGEMVVLEEKFTKLEISWQEQQQTIKDIETQYSTIQTKYEQLQTQYEQLEATRGQSVTEYQRLEKENFDLQAEIEDLKNKVYDAQQSLLESNTKYAEAAKDSKNANGEHTSSESSKIRQENEQIKKQLLQIQTEFNELQKEYDDLSNQLMDNLQDSECLKIENSKLQESLKNYEEKKHEATQAEAEIIELKSLLEKALSSEGKNLNNPSSCRHSSMRSSGVCVEEEENFASSPEFQELSRKFFELSESLTEIELEPSKGSKLLFKSVTKKNSTPKSYKMYLKNFSGIHKTQEVFDMEIENIHLQGSFRHHSFHIVELSGDHNKLCEVDGNSVDINGCENFAEYIEKLKQEIKELKTINEQERLDRKLLLESTERACSEMREQITQLSSELLEKSIFVENCSCKSYQQQIEILEKEKTDITIICEQLQNTFNCTLNGSELVVSSAAQLSDDKLKELEQLKLREKALLEYYDAQKKTLEIMAQRCTDMEADLEIVREELKSQENEFKEKCNQLQLDNLQKLELSANEYRDNMKRYNKEWEERRGEYEQTIKDLQNQIDVMKQKVVVVGELKMEIQKETIVGNVSECGVELQSLVVVPETETCAEQEELVLPENVEALKQDKYRLELENLNLKQQLISSEELLDNMKVENLNQFEELTLLDAKLAHLEELLADAKHLHVSISRENASLKTEIDDIREDLDCIPILHDKNQQLSDEMEKLNQEYAEIKEKFQKTESQIPEFPPKDNNSATELADVKALAAEKKKLENDFDNLKEDYKQVQNKLQKAEQQIQALCSEDLSREELIITLQEKLCVMTTIENEKAGLEIEIVQLKETINSLQTEDVEIENLKQQVETLLENVAKLQTAKAEFALEKSDIEDKLRQVKTEYDLLQTEKVLLENQLHDLSEEGNSLREQCNILQEEKKVLEEQLKCLKEKEKLEKVLEEIINEKADLTHNLRCVREKFESTQNQLKENEKLVSLYSKEKVQIEEELESLKKSLNKTIQEKHKQLEETEREKEKTRQENANLFQDLQALREGFNKAMEEKHKQEQVMEKYQNDNSQLKEDLSKLEEEKQKQKLCLDAVKQECSNLQQKLKKQEQSAEKHQNDNSQLKEDLSKLEEDKLKQKLSLEAVKQECSNLQQKLKKQEESVEKHQNDNSQLKEDLSKLEEEKQKQKLSLDAVKQECSNLQQEVKVLKESLSKIEQKKQEMFNNLENTHQKVKQQNQQLQKEVNDLNADLVNFKVDHQKELKENTRLQTELHATKASLTKLQEEQQNLQEKLLHYQKLQDDKNKLETSLNVLKKAQKGALSSLQEEKDQLRKTLQQYEKENKEFKEKEGTLQQKVESLSQQLHEMRGKAKSYEKILLEHEEVESVLTTTTTANRKLQEEISQLASQQEINISKIENLSIEIEKLNKQLGKQTEEKQMLQTKLSHLKETLQAEQSSLRKENNELKSSTEELKLKYDSLQLSNTQLDNLNKQMEQQLSSVKQKLKDFNNMQEELKVLKAQHSELQQSMKKSIEEARCSSQALHEEMLQKQLADHNSTKRKLETKLHSLTEENLKLSASIEELNKEKVSLEQKLREITVRNFEQDLQRQAIDATANISTDSNSSHSSRGRRSLERLSLDKISNISLEEKLSTIQQKHTATTERKNRRLSTHDERRRQSYWGADHDKGTMTDPIDTNCNCVELDLKLKECERNLFIKNSQVTTLNMQLKYHPMKEENALLKKRLQEEQDKHRAEIKRCKSKLHDQTAKTEKALAEVAHYAAKSAHVEANAELASEQIATPVLPKVVADAETQTIDDLNTGIQKLQGKYNDLKNICRHRFQVIKDLEGKMAQKENSDGNSLSVIEATQIKMLKSECESLQNELKTVKEKYENAKKVLSIRREEIIKLRSQLEQAQ